ncbi:hypothetical protein KZX46_16785 [Polymorphobacter sp. PAMC 29334]|uniref:hypothetical protein n=1 Tax=Polymorphobacter sp. PAMC 29334 TaxID=2862331 RepID=UPI001C780BF7|nr:hypothetical protein [Polymorphobacter sp. PAMC 29334]QYE34415.1 hypothetical protein KZX46_16785 [Polymorphobacter sp. PAMC 29334]
MRFALFIGLIVVWPTSASAETVGTSQQAQTVAPSVALDRPQALTCGAAPAADQINRLVPVVRQMFPDPHGFNAGLAAEVGQPCQRNRAAAYLINVIAGNNWAFTPRPGMAMASAPLGPIACGPSAHSAALNAVIAKIRPLFADPGPFNANIGYLSKQPCVDGRATLFVFRLMADNNLAFHR